MRADIPYEEYLRRVSEQRQRDADRFTGADDHLDEPIYDPSTGKLLNPKRPRLVIELDEEGLPVIVECRYNSKEDIDALATAAENQRRNILFGGGEDLFNPRQWAIDARLRQVRREEERAQWIAERPFECGPCQGRSRFKTERGLAIHARVHSRQRPGDTEA